MCASTLRAVGRLVLADFLDHERDGMLDALLEWLRIPSISADPAHRADVRASAAWCAERMRLVGLEHVALIETAGHPSVYGDWVHAPGAPTVLVYGHHDVQPVDPLDAWVSPPFNPKIRDGQLFARGAIDDKGQVLYHLEAVRGLLHEMGRLPVNLKVLVEGEEEDGSRNFEELLDRERDRLACDVIVVSDTGMLAEDVPSMCTGMRGLLAFDVEIRTAEIDLHSGSFGGAVPNAAHEAARLVAALHDADRRVTIPGFYDDVRELTEAERRSFAAVPFDDDDFRRVAGVQRLEGEAGTSTLERIWARPTAEVTSIRSGYAGEGMKTIVPATARLNVTFRLVTDQDPDAVSVAFERWVHEHLPPGVDVTVHRLGGVAAALTPVYHPAVAAAARAIERVWGRAPLFTREGGSGPEEALARFLDRPVVYLGVGLPDDCIHAPNERAVLDQLWRGFLAVGELWCELGNTGDRTDWTDLWRDA